MTKSRSGFTLVELAIVIAVIGIIAAIVLGSYNAFQQRSRDTKRLTDVANIAKALEIYYDEVGSYPDPTGTNSTVNSSWYSSDTTSWNTFNSELQSVQAIDKLPIDPKNNVGSVTNAGNFNYAYYSGQYCGVPNAQMYLILYRLESGEVKTFSDGECTAPTLGPNYSSSYYRNVKTGL